MSLYNALFGTNPLSPMLLEALGVTTSDVPRFRDCYLEGDASSPKIVVYTRTGGGNREFYESEADCREAYPEYFTGDEPPTGPWNSDLRALPGFLRDEDDDFDSTYAYFYFSVPEAFKPIIKTLGELRAGNDPNPSQKWEAMLTALRAGSKTPETERALAVGEKILGQITPALSPLPHHEETK